MYPMGLYGRSTLWKRKGHSSAGRLFGKARNDLSVYREFGRITSCAAILRKQNRMNNLKLKILEHVYARPGLSIGGLADAISPGPNTEQEVRYLLEKGFLFDHRGLELSKKGFACIDSASFKNRAKRIGQWALGIAGSVVAVVIGNWLWNLIQSSL